MKITMYELLGLVKDGKAPKKIKYDDIEIEYDKDTNDYYPYYDKCLFEYTFSTCNNFLNDEVEILEEEKETKSLTKKDIEALGYACGEIQKSFINGWTKSLENKPLEEEKKIPEKLGYFDLTKDKNEKDENGNDLELHYTGVADTFDDVYEKINDILDYLDYLKSKGEE